MIYEKENTTSDTAWLTIAEASRLTGIPGHTLRNRAERGSLPHYKADGYHVMVNLSDINAWKDRREDRQKGPHNWGANAHRVLALHDKGYTDMNIASAINISRQRVSQIRQRSGLSKISQGITCRRCGVKFFPERPKQFKCVDHRYKAAERIVLICQECGTSFNRRESTVRPSSPGHYCSRACRNQSRRGQGRADSVPKICTECGQTYRGLASTKKSVCRLCRPKEWYRRNKGNR